MTEKNDKRKTDIAKARAVHHKKKTETHKRLDTYVLPETKDNLKKIKSYYDEVLNEGEAVDKAVSIAIENLEKK